MVSTTAWQSSPAVKPGPTPMTTGASLIFVPRFRLARMASTTASGFKAIGTLFNSLFGVNYHTAMIVGAIVVIGYTVMGGFMAVSFTDLIQSIFMTIALIAVVLFGIHQAGGLTTVIDNASALPGYLDLTTSTSIVATETGKYGFLAIPVVDAENRLVGIVTIDDAIIMKEVLAERNDYSSPMLRHDKF